MEAQLQYKFDVFEGPLDLLLSLISKNKIDIYDIQISELLDQYMEQIAQMRKNRMDIASEFLTMASRLVYIKSVMLLPKYEEEAEELKKLSRGLQKDEVYTDDTYVDLKVVRKSSKLEQFDFEIKLTMLAEDAALFTLPQGSAQTGADQAAKDAASKAIEDAANKLFKK